MVYNFNSLKEQILEYSNTTQGLGVQEHYFAKASRLHLTLLMLNLAGNDENGYDDAKLENAKKVLRNLQSTITEEYLGASQEGSTAGLPKPLYLTFKGLQTFQYLNPTSARVLYCDIKKDENYEVLRKITSKS